jgi:hypothetical protein
VPSLVDDLVGAVGLVDVDDIDLFTLLDQHAALPPHLVGGATVVEARQRAFMRLRRAWTERPSSGIGFTSAMAAPADSRTATSVADLSMGDTPRTYWQEASGADWSAKAWFSALPELRYRKGPPS